MFIFYFLGVGLPYHSIFCQFWLCKEAQCVYLCRHLGSQELYHSFLIHPFTDGHLGCFQHLAIANCAAMNIGVCLLYTSDAADDIGQV